MVVAASQDQISQDPGAEKKEKDMSFLPSSIPNK